MNHFKGAVSLSRAIEITYEGMSKDEQAKLDLAVRSLFPPQNKAMTPTPRTDERANSWESTDGQWVNAEFARQLERELANARKDLLTRLLKLNHQRAAELRADLATERAEHEETVTGARMLADAYSAERALADKLAETLANVQGDYATTGAITTPEVAESLAAWKEARNGTR